MRIRSVLVLAVLAGGAAHSTPLPNLSLSCPDQNAINQVALDACQGYVYQIATNDRIVVSPSVSSYFWRRAADLAASELIQVCTIPVEPGAYSSCRDATGARRTAFVRKDSVISGHNAVTVSKTGGNYTDPVAAAKNAFAGDTWCVAPQWPSQPCVMAIGKGIFILREELSIPEGLAVSGNGKGDTMLVADNGVGTAVSSFGNVRISDLTIVNSGLGAGHVTGLAAIDSTPNAALQLHGVAIHVAGGAQSAAVGKSSVSLEIQDSEFTAVGADSTGIRVDEFWPAHLWLERSYVSAEVGIDGGRFQSVRLVDSQVFGNVFTKGEHVLFEFARSEIVGDVTADKDYAWVGVGGSSIKGTVTVGAPQSVDGAAYAIFTNTNIEGDVYVHTAQAPTFNRASIHGAVAGVSDVRGSYIINSSTAATLSGISNLEQTFVQGMQAVAVDDRRRFEAFSSVLAGHVSVATGSTASCADTYGADYELLSASCQAQAP